MDFFVAGWCQFINILLPSLVSNTLSVFPIYSCTKAWSLAWFLALLSDAASKFSIIPFTLTVGPLLTCAMTSSYLSFCSFAPEEWDDCFPLLMCSDSESLLFTQRVSSSFSSSPYKIQESQFCPVREKERYGAKWDQTWGKCTSHNTE